MGQPLFACGRIWYCLRRCVNCGRPGSPNSPPDAGPRRSGRRRHAIDPPPVGRNRAAGRWTVRLRAGGRARDRGARHSGSTQRGRGPVRRLAAPGRLSDWYPQGDLRPQRPYSHPCPMRPSHLLSPSASETDSAGRRAELSLVWGHATEPVPAGRSVKTRRYAPA
jgi:hypothetical protein